jgi:hydroxyacylglutathione hydrolase
MITKTSLLTVKKINLVIICLFTYTLSFTQEVENTVDLNAQHWYHGSENCKENTNSPIQVVQYNSNTWILRQNICTHFEAPFMFLFIGANKALLMDTGATQEEDVFPLYETVNGILNDWSEKNGELELIVAHTHSHNDHYAADRQFMGKPNTTVVPRRIEYVKNFFQFQNWPEDIVELDLGNRIIKIIPIPGHQKASIAVYDTSSKILLTGDTFYPGRLYVDDWDSFGKSINRLVHFTEHHEISYILGNHIEMSTTDGIDYPMGSTYHPQEHKLPLTIKDLKELQLALTNLGNTPTNEVHKNFIIYPINH